MRVAGYGGLVLALPIVMWQIWRFITPALHSGEQAVGVLFVVLPAEAPPSPAELRTVEACAELLALTVAARSRIAELERTVATIAGLTAACETDVRGV